MVTSRAVFTRSPFSRSAVQGVFLQMRIVLLAAERTLRAVQFARRKRRDQLASLPTVPLVFLDRAIQRRTERSPAEVGERVDYHPTGESTNQENQNPLRRAEAHTAKEGKEKGKPDTE